MTTAIYPGSFDPITHGHLDIALRAARIFDELIISIYEGSSKPGQMFPIPERVAMAEEAIAALDNPLASRITVTPFDGLVVSHARAMKASTIVRGLRAVSDFEYEFKYAHMNEHLAPEVEVVCFMTSARNSFISSSLIREAARLGGNLDGLVPDNVAHALTRRFGPDSEPSTNSATSTAHHSSRS